jgi:hypothetical protein
VQAAVLLGDAQFFEFVHGKIDARAGCAHHFRQHLLRHFGDYLLRFIFLAITGEQPKNTLEPFLARIKKLIH